jgi:hypothetical protein
MGLDKLKVAAPPPAFAEYAQKHNALVALIETIVGKNGAKVTVTEGKIVIEASGGSSEGAAIDVVGSDGKLNKVPKHSTWATPTAYPTELRAVNGSAYVFAGVGGLTIHTASGPEISLLFASITRDMSVRTITVCDGTTQKSMDIIASAPY